MIRLTAAHTKSLANYFHIAMQHSGASRGVDGAVHGCELSDAAQLEEYEAA